MSGLMTTLPASMAAAISRPDQSAHCSSSVMTSSSTQESTRVAGRIAAGSLATQQRHDLVGAHPRHFLASRRIAQPPNQPLPPALGSLGADDLKRAAAFDDLHLVPGMHPVLGPQIRWDGQLALAVQNHDDLRERVTYYDYYVILPTPRRGRKETATDGESAGSVRQDGFAGFDLNRAGCSGIPGARWRCRRPRPGGRPGGSAGSSWGRRGATRP